MKLGHGDPVVLPPLGQTAFDQVTPPMGMPTVVAAQKRLAPVKSVLLRFAHMR